MLLAEYAVVGLKGEKGWTEGVPDVVMAYALDDLSTNRLLWQDKNTVPAAAENGEVLGVKLLV